MHSNDENGNSSRQSRRRFLGGVFAAAGVIGSGISAALPQKQVVTAAPPKNRRTAFTQQSIDRFILELNCDLYRDLFGSRAQQDLKTFVRENFALRSEQQKVLEALSPEQVKSIQRFFKRTVEKKTRFRVVISYGSPAQPVGKNDLFVRLPPIDLRNDPKKGITFIAVEEGCS